MTFSGYTSRRIKWQVIEDTLAVTLDHVGDQRAASKREGLVQTVDPDVIKKAFQQMKLEFQAVLNPLRRLMKVVAALTILSACVSFAGATLALLHPIIGCSMSIAGLGSLLGLVSKAWLLSRDQAMLELIPGRYELAMQVSDSPEQLRKILTAFLSETSSLRKGR
jgi:hypothetical protein